jgi:ComF family protein
MQIRSLLSFVAPPLCAACGASAGSAEPLCGHCRAGLRWLGAETVSVGPIVAWAPLAYEGAARALVRGLKFRGMHAAARTMAAQIVANAPPDLLTSGELVPAPLHPARMRRRGYNQAERLAAAIAELTGLPVSDCLERSGPPATQVGRDRTERLAGIAGRVALREGADVPRRAIVVDDVLTTGATISACATTLAEAGAEQVLAMAYARTPGR